MASKFVKQQLRKLFNLNMAGRLMKAYTAGSRIAPSKNAKNDKAYGLRIDAGELVDGRYRILYLQVNSEAESPGLKQWRQKHGTHANLAVGRFDTQAEDPEEEAEKVFELMQANAISNLSK